jgi:hypothetical protein
MPRLIRSANKVQIVPKDGEIEITLNINISIDGQLQASADNADVKVIQEEDEKAEMMIPDFSSGFKLNKFGK